MEVQNPSLAMTTQAASVKPWSSGRVLTTSQREAKRRKDRITKRVRAERQNHSLEYLHSQIANLQNFVQTHIASCHVSFPSGDLPVEDTLHLPGPVQCFQDSESAMVAPAPPSLGRLSVPPVDKPSHEYSQTPPYLDDIKCTTSILEFANDLFHKACELNAHKVSWNDQLNQDAIIRGVLEGWHILQGQTHSCPLWKLLEQIDKRVFIQGGVLTRISMLRMIHRMYQAFLHVDCFKMLPAWYRPRPTQLKFPHHITADYFAWPGFRERLVISNCEILTDQFFKYFASCFRLCWPYSIGDAYRVDPVSKLYSFSDTFEKHVWDIRMWTMSREFFEIFPDLQDDMAAETPIVNAPLAPLNEDAVAMTTPNILCTLTH